MGQQERAGDVEKQHGFEIVARGFDCLAAQIDAGVIDQNVDWPKGSIAVAAVFSMLDCDPQIELDADRFSSGYADRSLGRRKIALAGRRHHEIKAVTRQRASATAAPTP